MKFFNASALAGLFGCLLAFAAFGCGESPTSVGTQAGASDLLGRGGHDHDGGVRGDADGGKGFGRGHDRDADVDVDEAADEAASGGSAGGRGNWPGRGDGGARWNDDDSDGGVDEECDAFDHGRPGHVHRGAGRGRGDKP